MKKLFQIELLVYPSSEHPQVDNFKFGILLIWLYSTDERTAFNLATAILAGLPYKKLTVSGKSYSFEDNMHNRLPIELEGAVKAAQTGLSLDLITWPKGAVETQVLGNWPSILPPLP